MKTAVECRAELAGRRWDGCAVYLLWDRVSGEPLYCGTSETPSRLRGHLDKDGLSLREPKQVETRNPQLLAYCRSRRPGFLGVSYALVKDKPTAQVLERAIIGSLGIRREGGKLYNQRLSG